MKIKSIKINAYGKVKDLNIDFDKINIIYGKNEAGKSTTLSFLINMFYGISKNKNGKNLSDYDKYIPWNENEFSGKLEYQLDNNERYKVFRNFNKKNPDIFNEANEDISKNFYIDKKDGNQFFYEQTKIDRQTVTSTVISNQKEIEIDNLEQSQLIQKIANLSETGDEEVSYKKAMTKMDKMLLTEVGTEKSQDRPINISMEKINQYQNKLNEIKKYKGFEYIFEKEKNQIKKEIEEEENNKKIYQEIKNVLRSNAEEEEKIKIKNRIIDDNNNKIKLNKTEKSKLEKNKNKKTNIFIFTLIILLNIISLAFLKNNLIKIILISIIPVFILYVIFKNKKYNSNYIDAQISVLEKNNNELQNEIIKLKEDLIEKNKKQKEILVNKYGNNINDLFNSSIEIISNNNIETLNELKLKLHKIELDRNNIEPQLEELAQTEENLEIENNNYKKLNYKANIYMKAKEILELAYNEMKKNITPKFERNLSEKIHKFSSGNYSRIILNEGLKVELENGKVISLDSLSEGTIEQIYLALRLSVVDELSSETLPIILDEAFAYYDDERLKSSLDLLRNLNNQIIIFTCTDREKIKFDEMGQEYNYIEL